MVNEEIISHLPLLYLYLSFLILIITVTITSFYPSLTLKLLYFFNFPTPFFPPLRKPYIFLYSLLIYLPSPLLSSFLFRSALSSSSSSFFPFFQGFLNFSVRPYLEGLVVLLEHPSGKIR